jgi:hypothetical protein
VGGAFLKAFLCHTHVCLDLQVEKKETDHDEESGKGEGQAPNHPNQGQPTALDLKFLNLVTGHVVLHRRFERQVWCRVCSSGAGCVRSVGCNLLRLRLSFGDNC